jgi:hypothetical protein
MVSGRGAVAAHVRTGGRAYTQAVANDHTERAKAKSGQLAVRGGEAAPARAAQASADGVRGDDGSPAVAVGRAVRHKGGTPCARGAIWRTRG